jgi:transcriptional regulator with XRE-family HTH domain
VKVSEDVTAAVDRGCAEAVLSLAERLRAAGLSASEVERRSGLARQTLCKILNGDVERPSWRTCATLGRVLGIDTATVLESAIEGMRRLRRARAER